MKQKAGDIADRRFLSALQVFQVQLAKCKTLDAEEEKVEAADFISSFRISPKELGMAPAMLKLEDMSKQFIHLVGGTHSADGVFSQYDFSPMLQTVPELTNALIDKCTERWAKALVGVESRLVGILPDRLKAESLHGLNEEWVKTHLLNAAVMQKIGHHYIYILHLGEANVTTPGCLALGVRVKD